MTNALRLRNARAAFFQGWKAYQRGDERMAYDQYVRASALLAPLPRHARTSHWLNFLREVQA